MRHLWCVALLVLWVGLANAEEAAPLRIEGRAVDVLGQPLANARVYVTLDGKSIETTTTADDGSFRAGVPSPGTYGVAIATDRAYAFQTVAVVEGASNLIEIAVEIDGSGGEVIRVEGRAPPDVQAKPRTDVNRSLPYSDEAVLRDAWAKAWLLLDVDERGNVSRLKLLKAPGFGLDKICIEEAFKLKFTPAVDGAGKPTKTFLLWTFEWPSYGWLMQGSGVATRRPSDPNWQAFGWKGGYEAAGTRFSQAINVPCAGEGPLNLDRRNRAYRDCSKPDLTRIDSSPWITPQTMTAALAELKNRDITAELDKDYRPASPWPGYLSAGVSAALAVTTLYSLYQWRSWTDREGSQSWQPVSPEERRHTKAEVDKWRTRAMVLTATTIVSSGATLLLWHRRQRKSSLSVQPTETKARSMFGATATFELSF